jgi:hypothetical protein
MNDEIIKHPGHYVVGGYECRLVMSALGLDKYWNLANAFKYLWRALHKGSTLQDLKKCRQYLDFEIASLEPSFIAPTIDESGPTPAEEMDDK